MANASHESEEAGNLWQPAPGVYICGRQHSGNTMVTAMLGRLPGTVIFDHEDIFFEHRLTAEQISDDRARAEAVVECSRLPKDESTETAREHLLSWVEANPGASALMMNRELRRFFVRRHNCSHWVQKSTSYIFSAETILRELPEARLIYLLRNPYDIFTSARRRGGGDEALALVCLGWRRGLRLADHYQRTFPDRFRVIQYEELVTDPEPACHRMCALLGIDYEPDMLEVGHVNPSDQPYRSVAGSQGVNRSRIYYYADQLSERELAAMDRLLPMRLVKSYYGDLPHLKRRRSTTGWAKGQVLAGACLIKAGWNRIKWVRQTNVPAWDYFKRRLGISRSGGG
jgi:hypothetical protein